MKSNFFFYTDTRRTNETPVPFSTVKLVAKLSWRFLVNILQARWCRWFWRMTLIPVRCRLVSQWNAAIFAFHFARRKRIPISFFPFLPMNRHFSTFRATRPTFSVVFSSCCFPGNGCGYDNDASCPPLFAPPFKAPLPSPPFSAPVATIISLSVKLQFIRDALPALGNFPAWKTRPTDIIP